MTSTWGRSFNFIFLFIAGASQCGPDSVVSGALASEIGARENAQSAVSGVVNGKLFINALSRVSIHLYARNLYINQSQRVILMSAHERTKKVKLV